MPAVTSAEIAEVLASLLPEEGRAAPPQEELVTTLLELQSAAGRLAYLERHLPPRLAGRAALLSMRVREAIRLVFPGVVDT